LSTYEYIQRRVQSDYSVVGSTVGNTGPNVSACGDGRPVELTASTGIIQSPGYHENRYPNNAACQWLIRAPPDEVRIIIASLSNHLGLLSAQPTLQFNRAEAMFDISISNHIVGINAAGVRTPNAWVHECAGPQ